MNVELRELTKMADESDVDGEGREPSTAAEKDEFLKRQAVQMVYMLPPGEADARKTLRHLQRLVDEFLFPKNGPSRPTIVPMRPDDQPRSKT